MCLTDTFLLVYHLSRFVFYLSCIYVGAGFRAGDGEAWQRQMEGTYTHATNSISPRHHHNRGSCGHLPLDAIIALSPHV